MPQKIHKITRVSPTGSRHSYRITEDGMLSILEAATQGYVQSGKELNERAAKELAYFADCVACSFENRLNGYNE